MRVAGKKGVLSLIEKSLFIFLILLFSTFAYADDPALSSGLNWLKSNQKTDGSWGNINNLRDTFTVIDLYKSLGQSDSSYQNAINWINSNAVESNDFIVRSLYSLSGNGADVNSNIQSIISKQNPDGGWGYAQLFTSNVYDTAIVITNLKKASYSGTELLNGIKYLVANQNADGSWSYPGDESGDIILTSVCLKALSYYSNNSPDTIGITASINTAITWLKTKQNTDGSFGVTPLTNITSSFVLDALMSLLGNDQIQADLIQNIIGYLKSNQQTDGSWNQSAYETALALKNIDQKVNLVLLDSDVAVSNPQPESGEVLTIKATVKNNGTKSVENVTVKAYAEMYDQLRIELGEKTIAQLAGISATTLEFLFDTKTISGDYVITVVVDPENAITETKKDDNTATSEVKIRAVPDLVISNSDISLSKDIATVGDDIIITASVKNQGTTLAENVELNFYLNNVAESNIIEKTYIPYLGVGEVASRQAVFKANGAGDFNIVVAADPNKTLDEYDRSNNQASKPIKIETINKANLTVSYKDMVFSPGIANQGGAVDISVIVKNEGYIPASNITVNFYKGTPGVDGVLIGNNIIPVINAGESSIAKITWSNIQDAGEKLIYIKVDPDKLIDEFNKADNDTFSKITILSYTDLAVSTNSIDFNPVAPKDGDTVAINVTVKNLGQQAANNVVVKASESGAVIGTQTIPVIAGNSQGTATISYSTTGKKGAHSITIVVDPDNLIVESSKDNNTASKSLGVQDANLWLTEQYISPNGDGIKDSTQFFFRLSTQQTVKVIVVNENGETVREFTGGELENTTGGNITWDGRNTDGVVVNDGQYQFKIVNASNNILGNLAVIVDNNQSSLAKALGTKYFLNNNLTCMLPDLDSWRWFPDESGILGQLSSTNGNAPEYPSGLYSISSDGQDIVRVIPAEWSDQKSDYDYSIGYELSPDGNQIAIILNKTEKQNWSNGVNQLWVVDRDGRNLKQLDSNDVSTSRYIGRTKWSTNSGYIAYSINNELWMIKPDGTGKVKLDSNIDSSYLVWSSDSTKIAYINSDYTAIKIKDIGSNKQNVMAFEDWSSVNRLEWFGDQKIIVLHSDRMLWLMDINGTGNDINLSGRATDVSFSPDKSTVAFTDVTYEKSYVKMADRAGNVYTLHESAAPKCWNWDGSLILKSLSWSPDSSKIAFYDDGYEKIKNNYYKQYLVVIDLKTRIKKLISTSECVDISFCPESYHIYTPDGDSWTERGVIHYNSSYETQSIDLSPQYKSGNSPFTVRIIQKGMDAAHIDYVALSVDGTYYKPSKAVNAVTGEDILDKIISQDSSVADAYNATIDLQWENLPSGNEALLVLNANEEMNSSNQSPSVESFATQTILINAGNSASSSDGSSCSNDGGSGLQWISDNISLLSKNDNGLMFVIDSNEGTKTYLLPDKDVDNLTLSPFSRYITYTQVVDESSACYGRAYQDIWAISSLLNLTVDLQVKKEKSAVILRGTAADLNFEGYQLEYADAQNPDVWNLVKPPSDVSVINDVFTTWVPPYEGVFYVKLTAWDKAGNVKWDRKRVTWGLSASVVNYYKTLDIISPNGDGIQDYTELHYSVLEPVHLEFNIFDANNNIIRTYLKDYTTPMDDYITWDGRDNNGNVVADGDYRIQVFDYDFYVKVDNTPPDVNVELTTMFSPSDTGLDVALKQGFTGADVYQDLYRGWQSADS